MQPKNDGLPLVYFASHDLVFDPAWATARMSEAIAPGRISALEPGGMIDTTVSFGLMPSVQIWHAHVRKAFDLQVLTQEDRQIIYFPGEGTIEVLTSEGPLICDGGAGVNVEAAKLGPVRFNAGRRGAGMGVDRTALLQRLGVLLDVPLRRRLEFAPQFETPTGQRAAVAEMIYAVNTTPMAAALTASPATAAKLAATIIDLTLQSLPHNYRDELARPAALIAPSHVKRAMDYVQAHPQAATSVDELAELCGVSIRALQYGFRRFLEVSPAEYIRSVRLEGVRQALMINPHAPLTKTAQHWGFSNLSRFIEYFQAAYGETPNQLRRRTSKPNDVTWS